MLPSGHLWSARPLHTVGLLATTAAWTAHVLTDADSTSSHALQRSYPRLLHPLNKRLLGTRHMPGPEWALQSDPGLAPGKWVEALGQL